MPVDNKYGRVTLENQRNIGDDEPVVVFRAQDSLLPLVLIYYRMLCAAHGSPDHHIALVDETQGIVVDWQAENYTKVPSSDGLDPRRRSEESETRA